MTPPSGGGRTYRGLLVAIGAVAASFLGVRLALEIHRLLVVPNGPIDLIMYSLLVRDWFAGVSIYTQPHRGSMHAPAVYLLLWPLIGWGPRGFVREIYAAHTVLAIGAFAVLLLREARPASRFDRGILAGLIVASYPAAVTVGNGQITFHVLLAALAGVLIQRRETPGIGRDAALAALFLFALVKPHLTLPFFWVIAFSRGWFRPAALAVSAYLAATAVSIALHGVGFEEVPALLAGALAKGSIGATGSGYGNLNIWLAQLGLREWAFLASGLLFALHGLWAWRHRGADVWILVGVAAIVARLWAYHRLYDDLLLVLPLIALYRLARHDGTDRAAWGLFLLGGLALAAPITSLLERASWILVGVWVVQLAFLMQRARVVQEPAAAVSAG